MKMSQNYVCSLFDGYADRFDLELVVKLDYKGHEQVVNALISALDFSDKTISSTDKEMLESLPTEISDSKRLNVVDIGSGTGLCGSLLRRLIPHIFICGIDLSQRMLERAVERQCYDSLILGDAEEYLKTCESSIDAIIAADVFIYIGDLLEILKSSYTALQLNGLLIFTVEELTNPLENISHTVNPSTLDEDLSVFDETGGSLIFTCFIQINKCVI